MAVDTGQLIVGRTAVERFIRTFHEQAFAARMRTNVVLIGAGQASLELDLIGTHVGAFAEISTSGREINVPCRISLSLRDGKITAIQGQMPMASLLRQIGAPAMRVEISADANITASRQE
jgi:hypothetical protein